MNKILKSAMLFAVAAMIGATMTSCSSDDNNENNSSEENFKDKTYGQKAINSCAILVTNLEDASSVIGKANLTSEQEAYLYDVLAGLVDNVFVPTYTSLADETERLEATLHGLNVNTITQTDIDKACQEFKNARLYWEKSEAFLGGAASDFDVDPTIDSWPLNRSLLHNYFTGGMTDDIADDGTVLGFHALEFILFRDGSPRKAAEFKSNDTYKNFTDIKGSDELKYAQEVCELLKERTFQLQVAWQGKTAGNASRVKVVEEAGLGYTTGNGLSYGDNLKLAGKDRRSTFASLKDAISQVLSDDEGSCAAIATEVGTAKIANPFAAGDISYVESPYSYNSIVDFSDNIRSIQNVWYGTVSGSANSSNKSFYNFFRNLQPVTNDSVVSAITDAIKAIEAMPSPFVKYCSTVWENV